ncbi:hypothetical protein PoB_006382700 [Plakobranchus ocellatus]|uniref:Ribosomal protein L2 n=1 Tax=Plakobranchus ocellatus TaxID=259542 RepID=A0AAV4CZG7_9GAST|nr:hypothetical protein PoB_006382700 [Plakobranchus ocellatus]
MTQKAWNQRAIHSKPRDPHATFRAGRGGKGGVTCYRLALLGKTRGQGKGFVSFMQLISFV